MRNGKGIKAGLIAVLALLAACNRGDPGAPPRVEESAEVPVVTSRVVVPVKASLSDLEAELNREIPATLYSIDQQEKVCVPPARITVCLKHERPCKGEECRDVPCKVGRKNAAITPSMSCRIVGTVTRGPIRLSGNGDMIHLRMPVSGHVEARDVGRVLSESADADAEVRANIRLGMTPDWQPTAKVTIDYDWTKKPGIELLGRRFTFAGRADPELHKVIERLEASIPGHLRKLQPRAQLEQAWAKGFTSLELNAKNPPVWMRLTPKQLSYGGYHVNARDLVLRLELESGVETFVGNRPPDPIATPLPPSGRIDGPTGFRVIAPVIADYAQLEPVLEKALTRLAAKPIPVPAIGDVKAGFGPPTIYATEGGRLAIGLPIEAQSAKFGVPTKGKVWLTGVPWNEPSSPVVKVRDLQVAGSADRMAGNLVLAVAQSPAVIAEIETALTQNFANDLNKLKGKIDKALTAKRLGDFVMDVEMTGLSYGVVKPLGQGAYLPVEVTGHGALRWQPEIKEKK
ncbi:DUF4403 family protein [Sandaracinobacter sp. RS1-74]|uniref:DUF4403 family protein n=1 Tax=Sandaracinobacteroides sayramensis TaxID=2913411 RepID=UPI001EDA3CA0|nr:DUF4403 family protein [Sandaracinobacteroides sayramensis]MCG2841938.1 DUF4403 family protein [Sandaracinobacteroides sayramensis]